MRQLKGIILFTSISLLILGCNHPSGNINAINQEDWKQLFDKELSLFGHRNWILIVDKAYPAQTAAGIVTIDTGQDLLDALPYILQQIEGSTHVKPIVYTDKELAFIGDEQVNGIDSFRKSLEETIGKYNPQVMLHDSVFVNIDHASKLFKVMVLKTNETIPYSSVFIELDCKYWSGENEILLRDKMANKH
jgi:L-fucose mutarotase/ribose pyranase (RbsD/FucU family)